MPSGLISIICISICSGIGSIPSRTGRALLGKSLWIALAQDGQEFGVLPRLFLLEFGQECLTWLTLFALVQRIRIQRLQQRPRLRTLEDGKARLGLVVKARAVQLGVCDAEKEEYSGMSLFFAHSFCFWMLALAKRREWRDT